MSENEKADYDLVSWLAMLCAGNRIGLLLRMACPKHGHPPNAFPAGSIEARKLGLLITILHYGFQVWSLYALVGLGLLYYSQKYNSPYRISSLLYPILGKKTEGHIGSFVDVLAIVAILFGVATTLGLGVQQINGGLNYLWKIPVSTEVQIVLILSITLVATWSVVSGVDKGIRILSLSTAGLCLLILAFVAFQLPVMENLKAILIAEKDYLINFIPLSLSLETVKNREWQQNWTTFYWSWWIAWSPFVGMFIARISKGRTLREYILGTMLAPAMFCSIWIVIFSTLAQKIADNDGGKLMGVIDSNFSEAFSFFLDALPFSEVTSTLTLILLVGFFVTSSDSGSLVVDMLAAKGNPHPPVWQRVFWSLLEGALAATLLLAGGLNALQAGSLLSTLPFGLVIIGTIFSLPISFLKDTKKVD